MTSRDWVRDRTTKELLALLDLLTCMTKPIDMPSNDPRLRHISQVKSELHIRQQRQIGFMDRLDGRDNPA